MKRLVNCAIIMVAMFSLGTLSAAEYGENDYVGNGVENTMTQSSAPQAAPTQTSNDSDSDVKCFWGYRWYRSCSWYTPVVYYYRPVTYYYTWRYSYRYYYRYSYVCFYKSMDTKSATNENGIQIQENPQSGTPLASLGIVKGDVITSIDGKAITHPSQLEEITTDSKVQVIRANENTSGTQPQVSTGTDNTVTVEYGANEY